MIGILTGPAAESYISKLRSGNGASRKLAERTVDKILRDVRKRRDLAVIEATARFDSCECDQELVSVRLGQPHVGDLDRRSSP